MIRFSFFIAMMLVTLVSTNLVLAQDEDQDDEAVTTVQVRLEEFTADFSNDERDHFMAIYGNYNLISVVKIVREDVENAIDKCADANPDMEDGLEERYEAWDDAIAPIMDEASANLDNMIKVQGYVKKGDIEDFFEFLDETREAKTKNIDKVPVSTPEACEHLLNTMDETQDRLTQLLRTTLVSLPAEEEARRAEEAADSEEQPEQEE